MFDKSVWTKSILPSVLASAIFLVFVQPLINLLGSGLDSLGTSLRNAPHAAAAAGDSNYLIAQIFACVMICPIAFLVGAVAFALG
ncbi:MAG: hypothetical protein JNK35_03290 [Phycisphaerae bacterium]|nr:hypothetical protein [Phycisphaerae bacterium]